MTDWSKFKVVDLRAELKNRDLPQNGLKAELVARLEEADAVAADAGQGISQTEPEESESMAETEEASKIGADSVDALENVGAGANDTEPSISAEMAPAIDTSAQQAVDEERLDIHPLTEAKESVQPDNITEVPISVNSTEEVELAEAPTAEEPPHQSSTNADQDDQIANDAPSMAQSLRPQESATKDSTTIVSDEVASKVLDSKSRKRRSKTPPPDDETDMRKRPRTGSIGAFNRQMAPLTSGPKIQEERARGDSMEIDHDVVPAVHPATNAVYIRNLMRPLRPNDLRTHLVNLATPSTADLDDSVISTLFLDQIRTHAFVVFTSVAAASRVRSQLHDCVWPKESNRKPLFVDFIPSEKVQEWIDKEEPSGGGRFRTRWEVVYEPNGEGEIEARLEIGSVPSTRGPIPTGPAGSLSAVNALPTGPRAMREPPRGPRGFHGDSSFPPPLPHSHRGPVGSDAGPSPASYDATFERTHTHPAVPYKPGSDNLAERRLSSMRSYYTRDPDRPLGREINRYSFQNGDGFVDRGKEIFEGIRPPHRERARREGRSGYFDGHRGWRGGRGGRRGSGGGGAGVRTDRYIPSNDGGRRLFNNDEGGY